MFKSAELFIDHYKLSAITKSSGGGRKIFCLVQARSSPSLVSSSSDNDIRSTAASQRHADCGPTSEDVYNFRT